MEVFSAILIAAATLFAPVTTSTGPVQINKCAVAFINEQTGSILVSQTMTYTNGVSISFTNVSTKPVTSVTATGTYNGVTITDSWAGHLAAGDTLSIWKHYRQLPYAGANAKCVVTKVVFADGTTWPAGTAP